MTESVHLTIDGRPVAATPGSTLLQAARENGISIPTLCHSEMLRPLEGCRSDTRRLLLDLLLREHYGDCVAPCQLTCPAGIDIQGYLALISRGEYIEALKLIREKLPMPATIGRVCPHFCETQCRRTLVEEPININHLKRFVADYEMERGERHTPAKRPPSGHKVAIVGGGPAGLSAAYYLCLLGHSPLLCDAMPELGGMLRYGIPEYRLPKKVLDWEIEGILQLGVEVRTNTRWGRDFTLDALRREGCKAIFLAIGAWSAHKLGVPGETLAGVHSGVEFLADIGLGKPVGMGERVAVIGGGNVAMDAARTGVRLGAKEMTVIYRRSREEMPASHEEIEGAMAEGIVFHFLAAPVRLLGANGRLDRIEIIRMQLGEPDASGRRRPVPVEGSETTLSVDMVITAIGQVADLSPLEKDPAATQAPVTRWKTLGADAETLHTGLDDIFTGGDVYRGPDTVVRALADGRRAAFAIHRYLTEGTVASRPKSFNILKGDLKTVAREPFGASPRQARARMPELEPAERITHFGQIDLGLPEEQARQEAERCLSCGCMDVFGCRLRRLADEMHLPTTTRITPQIPFGDARSRDQHPFITHDPNKCVRCRQCLEACTASQCSDAIDFDATPSLNERCVSCGLCLDVCPTAALSDRIAGKPGPFQCRPLETACTHCGCGCQLVFHRKGERFFTIATRSDAPPNYGHTCRRGRFDSFDYVNDPKRLKTPLVRDKGRLVESSWPQALDRIVREFSRLHERYGGGALAALGSPRATNEANYLLQKIFRTHFGTNHLDFPGSRAIAASMAALDRVLGERAAPIALREIEEAELIIAAGDRIEEDNPIVAAALRRASRTRGRRLICIASGASALGTFAAPALSVPQEQTGELPALLARRLLQRGLFDPAVAARHSQRLTVLKESLAAQAPDRPASSFGIPEAVLEEAAEACAAAGSLAIVYSEDVAEGPQGEFHVEALAGLALLTGRIGQAGSGIHPLCRHINTRGAADMGMRPGLLPGRLPLSDDPGRGRLAAMWGRPIPAEPGSELAQMIEMARRGELKGLYLLGGDCLPEEDLRALSTGVEFLVVQDYLRREAAEVAHVVLPAATLLEQEGSVTNSEGGLRRLCPVIAPPDHALPDWRIPADLLARLQPGSGYDEARSVAREIARAVPYFTEPG